RAASCVDGPRLARDHLACSAEVACSHVSGLLVQSGWTAGPDGVREPTTEERQNLRTPKLLAQNRRSLCIDPVHLKNMLRQVQSDRSNLAHGWLPFAADSIRQQFGTQMPQGGHPPHHSITSSARSKNESGIVRPSALAVVRLMTSSNLVGCSTGMSPGLAPRRILSTKSAVRWNISGTLGP